MKTGALKLPLHLHWAKSKPLKALEEFGVFVLGLFVILNIVFLFYPSNRTLPFAKVANISVGNLTSQGVVNKFQSIESSLKVTIDTGETTQELNFNDLGITIDKEATAEIALQHRNKWYLPVASWWSNLSNQNSTPIFVVDEDKLEEVAEKLLKDFGEQSKNATVFINSLGQAEITTSKEGVKYNGDSIKSDITRQLGLSSQSIMLKPSVVAPALTTQEAEDLAEAVNGLLATNLSISAKGQLFTPSRTEKASWLIIATNQDKSNFTYTINDGELSSYINYIANQVDEQTTPTVINIVDGVESSRIDGQNAEKLKIDESINTIRGVFLDTSATTATLATYTAQPELNYNYSYSPTNAGLFKLLEDWDRNNPGNFGVYVQELGGQGRIGSFNGNKHFVTASTYKMFLAFAVLQQVDQGSIDLSDPSGLSGWTVKECIEEMIRQSTNPCAVALGDDLGWSNATNAVRAAGFSQTELNNFNGGAIPGHKWSTPYDEAQFFAKLTSGQLLSSSSTSLLVGYLDTQVWKWGLTAGSPGSRVVEKVGWLSPYINNAGIVYSPNATYLVGIMSTGSSFGAIGSLAGELYNYFN